MDTVVVGSGVIGLTSAVVLREAGFSVRIVTRALPSETTSAVAAAVWYPYRAYPEHRVLPWSRQTLDVFYELAGVPGAGVSIVPLVELFEQPVPDPWWKGAVRVFRRATAAELRPGYAAGYVTEVPLVETPVYLRYLLQRYAQGGGQVEVVPEGIDALGALCRPGCLLVNCTGLGARTLANDPSVYPIRGQVVRVANPGLRACLIDDYGPLAMTYIIPRTDDCILGGTADEHAWDDAPDPKTTRDILRKSACLEPGLAEAALLEVRVGLRPARPEVRLALEAAGPGCAVIHNYGHGGAGFTLSWGCAAEVLALAEGFAQQHG